MSNFRKSLLSPTSSKPGSTVSSRSNSRAPSSRLVSSPTGNDSDDEEDFNFNGGLDDLILSKLNSYQSSLADTVVDNDKKTTTTNVNTHSIPDLFNSLSMSRTTVSTESRESLLARLYHLIISKPLILQPGLVNEFDVEQLIKYYTASRTENERLLTLKVLTTYCCSDIEEVSSFVISDVLPVLVGGLKEVETVSALIRSNVMICYASLLLCIYDGSGAYGLDETVESTLELIEGLVNSQERPQETDVIINGLHTIGVLITIIYHGGNDMNESIEELTPRIVDFLEDGDINISKAAGRVIALMYELYDYGDDEVDDEDDYDEGDVSPYYDYANLHSIVNDLAKTSSKSINKKLKKESKSVFRDILITLESYSSRESRLALSKNPLTLQHLKLSKSRSLAIQSWYSFIRLIHLRYIFNGGLHDNLAHNPELSSLIKKPKLNDTSSKFDKSFGDEDEEDDDRTFGLDQKRKLTGKKRDIDINNARAEKLRNEFGDLSLN